MHIAFAGFRHGHIYALYHLAESHSDAEIVGAWEADPAAKQKAASEHGVKFCYDSYEQLLADERVEAVAIGNYYAARGAMIIAALRAGKHVICDKPMCTTEVEMKEIQRLAKETNLSVFMMLDLRYNPNVLAARQLIGQGEIGEVHNVYFGGQHPLLYGTREGWYFEKGKHGGVINDIAVHGIDLLAYLTGQEPEEVCAARCWNAYATKEPDFLDSAQFMLKLTKGAGVIADVSYAAPDSIGFDMPSYWDFKIWGSKGMLAFAVGREEVELYQNGSHSVKTYSGIDAPTDYLSDFLRETKGDAPLLLSTEASLNAASNTLKIQTAAK